MNYMRSFTLTAIIILSLISISFITDKTQSPVPDSYRVITQPSSLIADTLQYPSETHLKNVQQLTFGGDNAEAYFSFDSKWIVFQRTKANEGVLCDQIFIGKIPKQGEKFEYKMVSTGKGRTTCGAFLKDGKHVIYASTHLGADTCPP